MKQITDDLAIDLMAYLQSKQRHKPCRDLLRRLENQPDMKQFERLWVIVFRTTEVRPEHTRLQSTIADISRDQYETFMTGEYGDKKLGICTMFKCNLSSKQIQEELAEYIHGGWDNYFLAAIPNGWVGKGTTQLRRWLNNV